MNKTDYIPFEECKHGFLYRIHSRNLRLGVYDEAKKGFVGIREKFGSRFLATEYHYDTGAPFGTARPKKLLKECPIKDLAEHHLVDDLESPTKQCYLQNKPLFEWMEEMERAVPAETWSRDPSTP